MAQSSGPELWMLCGSFAAACVGVSFAIESVGGGGLASGGIVAGGDVTGSGVVGGDCWAKAGHAIAMIKSACIGENFIGLSILVATAGLAQDSCAAVGRCAGTAVDGSLPDAAAQPNAASGHRWASDVLQGLCAHRPGRGSPSGCVLLVLGVRAKPQSFLRIPQMRVRQKVGAQPQKGRKMHGSQGKSGISAKAAASREGASEQ